MLKAAFFIGIYSYVILFFGLVGWLSSSYLFSITSLFVLVFLFISKKDIENLLHSRVKIGNKKEIFLYLILGILFSINLIGALGPELAFDALWYHLTIPKMYLLSGRIDYIHGNLLYYNLLPKLTEMLYAVALSLGNEVVAKLVHYTFGVLSCLALYKLARIYLPRYWAVISVIIFYSNLVVSWLSITAYSDLARVFFEILSFYYFVLYLKEKKHTLFVFSALLLGFAISAKILAIGSLIIFTVLILSQNSQVIVKLKRALLFIVLSVLVSLPWFAISFLYTGNPFFPLFTHLGLRNFSLELLSPFTFIRTFIDIFLFSPDPVNPVYIIFLPSVFLFLISKYRKYNLLFLYSICSYIIWYATSQSGGARFLSAYLPVYTILVVKVISQFKRKIFVSISLGLILFIAFTTIGYRAAANIKYVPVILGIQTKQDFLMKNLNFSFGDFFDENSDIKKIVGNKKVELLNMHNLFYVDFPFTLKEFSDDTKVSFILVQGEDTQTTDRNHQLLYKNDKTHVKLYKL